MNKPITITDSEQQLTLTIDGDNLILREGPALQLITLHAQRLPALLDIFRQLDHMRDFRRVANDLPAHLQRLDDLTDQAQAIYEADLREEFGKDEEWEAEYEVWFSLEKESEFVWTCGWRVREDEATVWALREAGPTPLEAAQAMLKELERYVPNSTD